MRAHGRPWLRRVGRGAGLLVRVIIGLLAVVLALGLVAVLLLHTGRGRELVRTQLVAEIARSLAGQARIDVDRIEGSLVNRIILHDVRLIDAHGSTAISADEAVISYDLLPLLWRTLRVNELHLREPRVHAYYGPDGKLNLATLVADTPAQEPSPWTVDIDALVAEHGRVRFRDQGGTVYRLGNVMLDGALRWQAAALHLRLDRAEGYWEDRNMPVAAAGSIRMEGTTVTLDDMSLRLDRSELRVPWLRLHTEVMTGCGYFAADVAPADLGRLTADDVGLRVGVRTRGWACRHDADEPWQVGLVARTGGGAGDAAPGRVSAQAAVRLATANAPLQGHLWLQVRALDPAAIVAGAPAASLQGQALAWWTGDTVETLRGTATVELRGAIRDIPGDIPNRYRIHAGHLRVTADRGRFDATMDVDIDAERGNGWANARADLDIQARVRGDTVTVQSARLDARVDDLGQAIPGPSGGSARLEVTARGPLERLAVRGTLTGDEVRVGAAQARRLRVRVEVDDVPAAPTGLVVVDARGVRYDGEPLGPVAATLRLREHGKRMALRFDVGSADARYAAAGRLTAVRGDDRVRVRVRRLDVQTRAPAGRRSGALSWHGRGGTVLVTDAGVVQVEGLAMRSRAADVHLDARLRRGGRRGLVGRAHVRVANADIGMLAAVFAPEAPFMLGRGHLEASVVLPRWEVVTSGRVQDFWIPARMAPVDGQLALTVKDRVLEAAVRVQGRRLGTMQADVVARTPRDLADARAWQRLDARDLRLVRVDLDRVRAAALASMAGREALVQGGYLDGVVRIAAGDGAGDASEDAGPTGHAALRLSDMRLQTLIEPVDAHLEARLDGRAVAASVVIDGQGYGTAALRGQATLPARPLAPAAWRSAGVRVLDSALIVVQDLDLRRLRRHLPGAPALAGAMDLTLRAEQQGNTLGLTTHFRGIRVAGFNDDIDGRLEVAITPARTTTSLHADLPGGAIVQADAALEAGTRRLLAQGVGALARAPIQGTFRIPDLSLSALQEALNLREALAGRIDAEATISGTPRAPVIDARIEVPRARIGDLAFAELLARGRYDRGDWSGRVVARQTQGGAIETTASGSTDPGARLRVQVEAREFRLGFLTPILRRSDSAITSMDGLMSGDVTLVGTLDRPRIRGWLRVWDGELRMAQGLAPISGARGYLVAEDDTLRLRLTGDAGRGTFRLEGEAGLVRFAPTSFEATLTTSELPIRAGTTPVAVNGRVQARGRRRDDLWRMDVTVHDGFVRLPVRLGDSALHETGALPDVMYVDQAARQDERAGDGSPVTVRMRVRTPGGVRVRGEDVEAVAEADLDITLIRDQVAITGVAQAVRGRVTLLDRRYDIVQGRAVFEGHMPPRPRLEVRLAHQAEAAMVYIEVAGTVEEPRIELAANPPRYDRAQVLSYVLGGNLTGGGANLSVEERTAGAIGGLLSSRVEALVKRTFPVDVLRVGLEEGAESIAFLTVGKWIREDVFVAYRRRFGGPDPGESINEAQLEYQVSESWVVEARVGNRLGEEGFGSVDVLWTQRF